MIIERRIQIGEYIFNVQIHSKSEHAHSLMTDHRKELEMHLVGFCSGLLRHPLPALTDAHSKEKG